MNALLYSSCKLHTMFVGSTSLYLPPDPEEHSIHPLTSLQWVGPRAGCQSKEEALRGLGV